MPNAVLVVGATGKVGREVTKQLAERGEAVRAGSRDPAAAAVPARATAVAFDFAHPDTWDGALEGADRLFALTPDGDLTPDATLAPFIEKAKAAGVETAVLMTAMGVEQTDRPYRKAELGLAASGLRHTFVRPNWFMQNFGPGFFQASITNAGGLFLPANDAKVSFVDTRDIAGVAVAALTEDGHDGKGYTVTGGQALTHAEAMAILSKAAGKPITYTAITDADMRAELAKQSTPEPMQDLFSDLFAVMRTGANATVSPHVAEVLGRDPIPFDKYANDHADCWR